MRRWTKSTTTTVVLLLCLVSASWATPPRSQLQPQSKLCEQLLLHNVELDLFRELYNNSNQPHRYGVRTRPNLWAQILDYFGYRKWLRVNRQNDPVALVQLLQSRGVETDIVIDSEYTYYELTHLGQTELQRFVDLSRITWGENFKAVYAPEILAKLGAKAYWHTYTSSMGLSDDVVYSCEIDGSCWHEYAHLLVARSLRLGQGMLIHAQLSAPEKTELVRHKYCSLDEVYAYAVDLERLLYLLNQQSQLYPTQIRVLMRELKFTKRNLKYYTETFINALVSTQSRLDDLYNASERLVAILDQYMALRQSTLAPFITEAHPVITDIHNATSSLLTTQSAYQTSFNPPSKGFKQGATLWKLNLLTEYEGTTLTIPLYTGEVAQQLENSRHISLSEQNREKHASELKQYAQAKAAVFQAARHHIQRQIERLKAVQHQLQLSDRDDRKLAQIPALVSELLKP
jgi:hypothetical protein